MTIIRNPENRMLYPLGLKHCYKCDIIKSLLDFNKKKNTWDGLRSNCRDCDKVFHQGYRSNPEKAAKELSYKQQYRQENRQKELEYTRDWREKNKSLLPVFYRKWHLNNKDKINAKSKVRVKQWIKDNLEKHRINGRNYRARSAKAIGSHTLEQWQQLLQFFNGYCPSCNRKEELTLDHIIPLAEGGTHYIDNIQPLCKSCNSSKMHRLIIDYRPREVRLWAMLQMKPR